MTTTTDYQLQAKEYLAKYGIEISIKATNSGKCPPFCDGKHIHGDEYRVTMKRALTGARLTFPFWNSQRDSEQGKAPTAYAVLACAGSDLSCPEEFDEFCAEFGYDTDSRKAEKTFRLCAAFGRKLRAFFDNEEMQAELQTIN